MEILVTGNIKWLENDFFVALAQQNKVVVCGENAGKINVKRVTPYQFSLEQEEFERLFFTFDFDYVVYFSASMEKNAYQEIAYLHTIFELCKRRQRIKLIYVRHTKETSCMYGETQQIIESACLEMCRHYAEESGALLNIAVPFIVAKDKPVGLFEEIFEKIVKEQRITLSLAENQVVDFLFGNDLGNFLNAFFEEGEGGYLEYYLSGGNEIRMCELINKIDDIAGTDGKYINVTYGNVLAKKEKCSNGLRQKYGWFPKENIINCLSDWYASYTKKEQVAKKRFRQKIREGRYARLKERVLNIVECVALFLVCEVLTVKTRDMQLVDFADFRLFFVVIVGMLYGLHFGVLGSVAVCIAHFASVGENVNWQIQFYNIVNWLPVATYMLAGSIAGYTKDRYKDMVTNAQKSQEVMEDKYIYLNELYTRVLENKENYSSQIVNYKNSFGRIYAATKQLNSVHPSELFYHAIVVLEDMMETQSVAIYSLDGERFARLNACSRSLMNELTKSLKLDEISECAETLKQGETWINRERIENCPDYACGIFSQNTLVGIIAIQHVAYSQMSIDYMNRFNIVSGLISDSLIRATEYQKISEKERMLAGTRILRTEAFMEEVEAQKLLKDNNRANYVLLRVKTQETDYEKISNTLQRVTRKNDILGLGDDGKVYILLSQADSNSMQAIHSRMENGGVEVEVVDRL